jgi:hypothetical protein
MKRRDLLKPNTYPSRIPMETQSISRIGIQASMMNAGPARAWGQQDRDPMISSVYPRLADVATLVGACGGMAGTESGTTVNNTQASDATTKRGRRTSLVAHR